MYDSPRISTTREGAVMEIDDEYRHFSYYIDSDTDCCFTIHKMDWFSFLKRHNIKTFQDVGMDVIIEEMAYQKKHGMTE